MSVVTLLYVGCGMVSGNCMGAKGAKALSPALGRLTHLKDLYLGGEYDNV